jgi:hypothetical protein
MPPSIGISGRGRDLGISGGSPGKGDANRTNNVAQFKRNYDEIYWNLELPPRRPRHVVFKKQKLITYY